MLSANGYDNTDADPNNIISLLRAQIFWSHFISKKQPETIKTSLQRIWKLTCSNEYKTKSDNKNKVNEYRITFF